MSYVSHIILLSILLHFSSTSLASDKTVFVGQILEQTYIPDLVPASCLKKNVICMHELYKYEFRVLNVLAGESLPSNVTAFRAHHGHRLFRSNTHVLVVLSRVENSKTRKLTGIDFFIEELSHPRTEYCLSKPLDSYIPQISTMYQGSTCVKEEAVKKDIKSEQLSQVIEQVQNLLSEQNALISVDFGVSIDGVYSSDEDEIDDECPDYGPDLDKYDLDPRCQYPLQTLNAVRFELRHLQGEQAKNILVNALNSTGFQWNNVFMEFEFIRGQQTSILEWRYNIRDY